MADQPSFRDALGRAICATDLATWILKDEELAIADSVLASVEMQQIRQLIAATLAYLDSPEDTDDDVLAERYDAIPIAAASLSGCVREWATTPDKEA